LRKYVVQVQRLYSNARNLRDFGKSLPWPSPPSSLRANPGLPKLKLMYQRWRALMVLRKVPREEWPEMHLKVIAADALKSQRKEWGITRAWTGNYLATKGENEDWSLFATSCSNLRNTDNQGSRTHVLFSSFIRKINKFNKSADRALVVTNESIYKMDIKGFKVLKKPMSITECLGITVTPGTDQLVVIHAKGGNDLVFSLVNLVSSPCDINRVGELIAIVLHQYQLLTHRELPVAVVPQNIACQLGNKQRLISVDSSSNLPVPGFKKGSGNRLTFSWPLNPSSLQH
jgi:myosin-1